MPVHLEKLEWMFSVGLDASGVLPVYHLAARSAGSELLIPSGGPYASEHMALRDMIDQESHALLAASRGLKGSYFSVPYERRLIDPGSPGEGWIWRLHSQLLCPLTIHSSGSSSFITPPHAAPLPDWP